MKLLKIEMENVKRVSLVRMEVKPNGLTEICGDNGQGKTSVLDGIIYALGGEKYRPSNLQRADGMAPAHIRIELSGGLVVERAGKNAALKVTDSTGKRHGQKILDDFVEELALNLPKFLAMRDADKADVLLRTLGIGDQLRALDLREDKAYNERHDYGVIVDQKRKFANEMKEYPDVPEAPLSAAELISLCQDTLARNAKRAETRTKLAQYDNERSMLRERIEQMTARLAEIDRRVDEAVAAAPTEPDESTVELEQQIQRIDEINAKVRANLEKAAAEADAEAYAVKLAPLTAALEAVRAERKALLDGAHMPLPELSIGKDGKGNPVLLYRGQQWDCMSTMEQFRVGTAIVRMLKPQCQFVLLDGFESFDANQRKEFDAWLRANDLQAIATRVGQGDDGSIVITDGYYVQEGSTDTMHPSPAPDDPIPMDDQPDRLMSF